MEQRDAISTTNCFTLQTPFHSSFCQSQQQEDVYFSFFIGLLVLLPLCVLSFNKCRLINLILRLIRTTLVIRIIIIIIIIINNNNNKTKTTLAVL